jgi:hypothetical protein
MSNLSSLVANLSADKINLLLPAETALVKGGTYGKGKYGKGYGKSAKSKSNKKGYGKSAKSNKKGYGHNKGGYKH